MKKNYLLVTYERFLNDDDEYEWGYFNSYLVDTTVDEIINDYFHIEYCIILNIIEY